MPRHAVMLSVARLMLDSRLGVRGALAAAVGIEALGTGLVLAGPYALKLLVDRLGAATPLSPLLLAGLVAMIVLGMATTVTSTFRSVYVQRVIDALYAHLVNKVLRHRLSMAGVVEAAGEGAPAGLLERLPYALQIVADGVLWRAAPVLVQTILCLALIGAVTPPRYAALMAAVLSGYGCATWLGARWHRAHAEAANAAVGRTSVLVGDVLRNARRVAHNGASGLELELLGVRTEERRAAHEALSWSLVRLSALQFVAIGLGLSVLLIAGGIDVEAGRLSVGDFVLVQAMATRLLLPLSGFGFVMSQAGVAIATIRDVLAQARDLPPTSAPDLPAAGPASVRIEHLHFAYRADVGGRGGLHDVTLDLSEGGIVAVVGPNGSGKSTLAQLIAGALTPRAGRILIGGRDMATIAPDSRHAHVLYVPQLSWPMNRSIGENGLYPPSTHDEETLIRLLTAWSFYGANETVDLARIVGDQGERLSGGQVQKLELARLTGIVVPVIILDEASSALDPVAEARILADLKVRMAGRTMLIVISHRVRVATMADTVVHLDAGRVVAVGRHGALMARPDYRRLWAES